VNPNYDAKSDGEFDDLSFLKFCLSSERASSIAATVGEGGTTSA